MTDVPIFGIFVFGIFVFGMAVGAVLGVGAWELAQYLGAHVSISWGAT